MHVHPIRGSALSAVIAALAAAMLAAPVAAITHGSVDSPNPHSNVGAFLVQRSNGTWAEVCSGSLVAPTVFLTASHCTSFVESIGRQAFVTFASDLSALGPNDVIHGTMHTNPAFNQRQSDPHDIAVITLDRAVTGVAPVQLPTAGLLARRAAQNGLKGQTFTNVGYGALERTTGGGHYTFGESPLRMRSTSTFGALNGAYIRLSQNASTGDGGTCFGDSGGPQFLGGVTSNLQTSITITGDAPCTATNVDYRLDTAGARSFLGDFVNLP
jgi:secreted trypsin-like serine protease